MTADQLAAARRGDEAAFEALVAAYRNPLHAYCYRMLGSVHDADDALQETLLAAWRGLPGFEGRSSLRSWLYRIATHACLRLAATRRRRALAPRYGPARTDVNDLGDLVTEPIWLEPYPQAGAGLHPEPAAGRDSDPAARYAERENVELVWTTSWRLIPVRANGQLAFACYHGQLASACSQGRAEDRAGPPLRLSAVNVLTLRAGQVAELTGFLDPAVHRRFGLAQEFPVPAMR